MTATSLPTSIEDILSDRIAEKFGDQPITPRMIREAMMELADLIEPPEFDVHVVRNDDGSITIASNEIPYT